MSNNYRNNKGNGNPPGQTQQNDISKDFYNPYAFVPLTNTVFLLDKKEKTMLSQDVPFKDGLSGTISIDFESLTPFCVCERERNANVGGKYFIPGTSVKGMIRNVFEIITMSNIRNCIADKRYSMRDLRNEAYELKAQNHPQKSGFLFKINGKYYIQECSNEQYSYEDIKQEEKGLWLKSYKSTKEKYDKLDEQYKRKYSYIIEYQDDSFAMWFFSGFMNNKKHEYLFNIPKEFNNLIPLKENEFGDFIFIHEKENDNASWKFWKRKIKNYKSVEEIKADKYKGIVPCFFRTHHDEKGEFCVKDLGFSFLYRQPYQKTIHDFLPSEYHQDGIDMAQAVFGYVKGHDALKGRVHFEHSFINNAKMEKAQTFILGSPKPTYYPFYLEQNNPGKLNTYFSKDTCLSGYKRYLIQPSFVEGNEKPSKVTKSFVPLSANTRFSSVIHFHNLRDYELGALIAAITFCNKQTSCFHSLGIAKTFGYGKLRVKEYAVSLSIGEKSTDICYKSFIGKMCNNLHFTSEKDYLNSISYLFEIAAGRYNPQKKIRYPKMKNKEFESIKNKKYSLKDFSPKK